MVNGLTSDAIRQVARVFQEGTLAGLSDGEILERFVDHRDETAFELLLRRHGPMVRNVCRQTLFDPHEVEDAFQATFLALVCKASSLRIEGSLGPWLYRVASRTSARARANRRQRSEREVSPESLPEPSVRDAPDRGEVSRVVHEELGRLPERLRAPMVLCYLEGMTHELAARQLQCPVGTVRSRLARARALLQRRITRRGIVTSAATMAAVLESSSPAAALSPRISRSLIKLAAQFASGSASIRGGMGVSASVAVLLEGVLNVMRVKKLVGLGAVLVAVGTLGVVVGVTAYPAAGQSGDRFDTRPKGEDGRTIGPDGRPIGSIREKPDPQTIVKTYYIGDLIFLPPSPKSVPAPLEKSSQESVPPFVAKRKHADLSLVIDLITSTVARGSWTIRDDQGKPVAPNHDRGDQREKDAQSKSVGSITPFFLSVSLIIRHTPEVHDEVADLLRKVRRLVESLENPGVEVDREEKKLVLGGIGLTPQPQSTDPKPVAARPIAGKPLGPEVAPKNISEIRFEGNATIPSEKIRPKVLSRVGQPLDMQKINADIKSLMDTNWFSNVEIVYKEVPPGSGNLILTFVVHEMPVLTHVEFRGRKAIPQKELEDKTGLKVKNHADPMNARLAMGQILRLYQEKGYDLAEVKLLEGGDPGDTKVVVQIFEGPKVKISSINFAGNQFASSTTLRTRITARKPYVELFGRYERDVVDDDRQKLVEYYQEHGFFEAKVTTDAKTGKDLGDLDLTFVIHEGRRFSVRNAIIEGNSKLKTAVLKADLELHSGRPFLQAVRDADKNRMLAKYSELGCIDTRIAVEPKFTNEPGVVDLVYKIEEGDPYLLGELRQEAEKLPKDHD